MAIINNNVQNVKFLRNQTPFESRELALQALENNKAQAADGTALLARYTVSGTVKTIVGFVYVTGSTHDITIFDTEGASGDVEKLRQEINAKLGDGITSANTATAQLAALSGNGSSTSAETSVEGAKRYADELKNQMDYTGVTTGDGVYVTNVTQSDGIVSATTATLPDASSVSGDSKVVIDVTQDKGQITATAANLTGVKLDGYQEAAATGDVATTDTLGEALGKLQKTIHEMDKTASAEDGKVVTTVSEVDGVVSETKANVKDLQLGGYAKDTTATGDIASGDTINAALSKLENKANAITIDNADGSINVTTSSTGTDINVNIKSGEHVIAKDGAAGLYTNIALSSITPSSTTVKEEYQLTATDGTKLGDTIKIYKDSSLVSITYITDPADVHYQNLEYVYIDASGETQTEYVDISSLVLEAEFASGVTVTDHVAHGVVDPTSETFLTVGADGFKLAGVQDAIDTAISGLDVSDSAVAGQYVSQVSETDGKIAVVRANVSAAVLNNYSKGSDSGAVASTDTINQAVSKLENQIDAAEEAAKAASTIIASGSSADTAEHLEIATTTDPTTSAKTYTFDLKDIASQTDLSALSAKTVTALTSTNGSITASIDDAVGCKTYDIHTDADKIQMSGFSADNTSALSGIAESDSIATAFEKTNTVITENERVTAEALTDLDGRIDTVSGDVETIKAEYISGVSVNGVAVTPANKVAPIAVTSSQSAATTTNNEAIVVTTNNSTGAITLGIANIDCGYYDGTQG